jgi:hypothetical protein
MLAISATLLARWLDRKRKSIVAFLSNLLPAGKHDDRQRVGVMDADSQLSGENWQITGNPATVCMLCIPDPLTRRSDGGHSRPQTTRAAP